ncbi:DUF779 domain-containing protein [Leucobacter luti]|uniref:DUF779 domain-containing protein n=1 Tax=Leucobacter luti TaxID=340320 RepID=A0A4Q7U5L5_9MICO|nr:DUF779 domain-containing protein [Leucobacter luti]MBL3700888.1 DUF779 domain-containing protein [Leucobacter luti]RZT68894.1 hypothetical protein EV139_0626 [Leucobacter luti]
MSEQTIASAAPGETCDAAGAPVPPPVASAPVPGTVAARPEVAGETESRLAFTPAALDLIERLWAMHGPLMFHQSGGCCDGSAPMCYQAGEFRTGGQDVLLGTLELPPRGGAAADSAAEDSAAAGAAAERGAADEAEREIAFWMSREQFGVWAHTHLTVDAVPGRGSGFSLEAPEGLRFLIRSRLLDPGRA